MRKKDKAEVQQLARHLGNLGERLDKFLRFEHPDAMVTRQQWLGGITSHCPEQGRPIDSVLDDFYTHVLPNGAPVTHPGFSSFITTGPSTIGVVASAASSLASPQRVGKTAFNYLEELSLDWMANLFCLNDNMRGVYCSGGSTANIVALGAARQSAFEAIGVDPAQSGIDRPAIIYASRACHRTIHRAASVLGLGRSAVVEVDARTDGTIVPHALATRIERDLQQGGFPVAIVVNAGVTSTGAIDDIAAIADIAESHNIWLHVDGAYGLPGILDPTMRDLYSGIDRAQSVIVDPHKWLGAPVGIGAVYVHDRSLLQRTFEQGSSDYFEGAFNEELTAHSLDSQGIPYSDFALELSSPARGAVVWALLCEVGKAGLRERICRHNAMAQHIAERARAEASLQLLLEPTLSITCFRYIGASGAMNNSNDAINQLNRSIHRQLLINNKNMPSTTMIDGKLALRPCFVGARTSYDYADRLVDEVLKIGAALTR